MIGIIILAAGIGSRMNLGYNKMLYEIDGAPIYKKTLEIFKCFDEIVVVKNECDTLDLPSKVKVVNGGKTRGESVYNGLKMITSDYVLIHDGARCYLDNESLNRCIDALKFNDAIGLGVKVKDTIKLINNEGVKTLKRDDLVAMQTPQGGKTKLFLSAYEKEKINGFDSTDDLEVIEKYTNAFIKIVEGSYNNKKVTTKEDLLWELVMHGIHID